MSAGSTWQRLESSLADYCSAVDLQGKPGLNRALLEVVQGIVFGGSVQLTNAARLYCHDAGELHGAGKRLSARLSDPKVDHHPWLKRLWAYQAGFVKELDPIAIDATELAKPYARHMEHQCLVRDASGKAKAGGEEAPLVPGYWVLGAYHWQEQGRILSPLMLVPYSQTMPGFKSENDCWQKAFYDLKAATEGRGVWVIDRGADRPEVYRPLLLIQPRRWIVRVRPGPPADRSRRHQAFCRGLGR